MGYQNALGMAAALPLETALAWHLQHNHYPPVPAVMIPVAARAVKAARRGEYDRRLRLPKGVSWRGESTAPVSAFITDYHLDAFLAPEEEEG
jgi:hypothetical protein